MDEKDLNDNLGTIARSGTKAFIEKLSQSGTNNSDLIGQFGVGFYSAFMAASKIDVYTRKAGGDGTVWHWSSDGTNAYEIEELKPEDPSYAAYGFDKSDTYGTAIEMHLNDDSKDYASHWKIDDLIKNIPTTLHSPFTCTIRRLNMTKTEKQTVQKTKLNSATAQVPSGSATRVNSKKKTTMPSTKPLPTTEQILSCISTRMQKEHRNTQHCSTFPKLLLTTCTRQTTKAV